MPAELRSSAVLMIALGLAACSEPSRTDSSVPDARSVDAGVDVGGHDGPVKHTPDGPRTPDARTPDAPSAPPKGWVVSLDCPMGTAPPVLVWDQSSGGLRLTGPLYCPTTFGAVTLTPTIVDTFVARLTPAGLFQDAALPITSPKAVFPNGVAVDGAGNIYLVGSFNTEMTAGTFKLQAGIDGGAMPKYGPWVAKVSPTGSVIWAVTFGDSKTTGLEARGIVVGSSGAVYIGGSFKGTVAFGSKTVTSTSWASDHFVAKLSASTGAVEWVARTAPGGRFGGLAVDSKENIVITGEFLGGEDVAFGSTIINGHGAGDFDVYVAKLTPLGEFAWASWGGHDDSTSPNSGVDTSTGIAVDAAGEIYVTGIVAGPAEFGAQKTTAAGTDLFNVFVAKLDANGTFLWAANGTGDGDQYSAGIAVESGGNSYITGSFSAGLKFGTTSLNSKGGLDVYLVGLSPSGQFLWARSVGGTAVQDNGLSVAHDNNGHLFASGWFHGTVDFEGIIVKGGSYSTFVWMIPTP